MLTFFNGIFSVITSNQFQIMKHVAIFFVKFHSFYGWNFKFVVSQFEKHKVKNNQKVLHLLYHNMIG
jgi:hypothetical protein